MTLSQQHKITIISLVLYWSALTILAHIPVPQWVQNADVSDKSLHFLAYLVLVFLVWFSVKPNEKANWCKIPVWLVLFIVTGYGAIDEVVQSFIGRNCDALDIAANFAGVFFGLLLFTFLTFRPATLVIAGVVIFGITNIAGANLVEIFPVIFGAFHLFSYAIFTVLWLLNMNLYFSKKPPEFKWLLPALAVPICFLLIVKISSKFLGREIAAIDIIIPVVNIIIVVGASFLRALFLKTGTG